MKRLFAILAFVMIIALLPSGINAAELTTTKNGITVKLLNNTDFCNEDCYSVYDICVNPLITQSMPESVAIMFKDSKGVQITEYGSKIKFAIVTVSKSDTKDTPTNLCKKITVTGKKGMFESVDNIPCFNALCFNEVAWWNTTCLTRETIISNASYSGILQSLNNTFGYNGLFEWFNNATEPLYVYNCSYNGNAYYPIGNETDQKCWENANTRLGNCPASVFNQAYVYWHLDEGSNSVIYDSSPSGFKGWITGTEGWNSTGLFGKAFNCNGSVSRKMILQDITPAFEGQNYTVEFYLTAFGAKVTDFQDIIYCSNAAETNTTRISRTAAGSAFFGIEKNGAGSTNLVSTFNLSSPANINKWHHLVIVKNVTNATLYVDNNDYGSITVYDVKNIANCSIGYKWVSNAFAYNGTLDEIALYNFSADKNWINDHYKMMLNTLNSIGSKEYVKGNVTFNVKDSVTMMHLLNVSVSCNDSYSNNSDSPFVRELNYGSYNCSFSKIHYSSNSSVFSVNSSSSEINITMQNFITFTFNVLDSFTNSDLQTVLLHCANSGKPSDNFSATIDSPYDRMFINFTVYGCNVSKNGYENFSFSIDANIDVSAMIYMDRIGGLTSSEKQKLDQVYFLQSVAALPEELIIQNQSCIDEDTLATSYNPVYCSIPANCNDVLTFCTYGCDRITGSCRGNPIETGALFIGFIIYMAATIIVPIMILTHHSNKKKRDMIIGFFTFFFMLVVYIITTAYMIPSIAIFFGNDYYVTTILVGMTLLFFPLINLILIVNNIFKDRY